MMWKMTTGREKVGAVYTTRGGGVSTFNPSQEEQEDSQEEFQKGSGVLIGWRRRQACDTSTKQAKCCAHVRVFNISLDLSCCQNAPAIFYLDMEGRKKKKRLGENEMRISSPHDHKDKKKE